MQRRSQKGFTLIELSIVLVIIGLIVGGVLVGQDLIRAAEVRATISRIEKYNTAVNSFPGKYDALPGDMNASTAIQFGFTARGQYPGEGDGNGIIEGADTNVPGSNYGYEEAMGETVVFWVDLTTANGLNVNLIDGSFNTASEVAGPGGSITGVAIGSYLPLAKLGRGNYVYVYSGGIGDSNPGKTNGINYFGVSKVSSLALSCGLFSSPSLSVAEAYGMDKKVDDGLPQSGNITAKYLSCGAGWAGNSPGTAVTGSAISCYDNGGNPANPMQYSLAQNGGAGRNCALSFQFQ